MDGIRRKTPPARQRQALDGFFSKPMPAAPRSDGRPAVRQSASGMQTTGRRVDDFRRTDGFHSQDRRQLGRQQAVHAPAHPKAHAAEPAVHAAPRSRTMGRKQSTSRMQSARRLTFRMAAFSLLLILVTGGILFGRGFLQAQKVFQGGSSAAALKDDVDPTMLKGEGDGRVNILLLGMGGESHRGGDLTDTIMVASIDPVNNQAVLVSLPRDLWTKMPSNFVGNYHKINAAYESGKYKYLGKQDTSNENRKAIEAGFQGVDGVVERVTGIPIHYNALVDFKAFSQAVDVVGGVTVVAPEQLYDPTMAWENKWNPVLAKAGPNQFNGKQALNYVRSRQTSSDFARGERQRALILALKDKATNMGTLTNPVKLSNLMGTFGDNVQTDISLGDMTRMAALLKKIPSNQIQSVGLADPDNSFVTTGNVNGLSVVMPKAGLEDYSKIQAYIRSKLKDGYIAKENATITILNGTSTPGLASEKADELKTYGYNVAVVDNAPTQDYNQTTIVDLSKSSKKYTLNYLQKRLGVKQTVAQLPTGLVAGASNIVIILGTDATATSQD